jgi:hypothetical protein
LRAASTSPVTGFSHTEPMPFGCGSSSSRKRTRIRPVGLAGHLHVADRLAGVHLLRARHELVERQARAVGGESFAMAGGFTGFWPRRLRR